MNLVIVESPSKAKTINKYLGKDYLVKASKGHVVDLPKSKIGVDVENNFKPDYQVTNPKSLSEIKKAFKEANKLILAVDLDREGEAIAWHIARELKVIDDNGKSKGKKPVERIVFSEITKDAIEEAIKNPRSIDISLVNAQQARRILDRVVGYKLSPLLWKKISFGLSAGRVQSVALRLVVEREEERDRFKPEEYWTIESFTSLKSKPLKISLIKSDDEKPKDDRSALIKFELAKISSKKPEIRSEKASKKMVEEIKDKPWVISKVEKSEVRRKPKAPFTTSTLQQSGVNLLGFSARRTMQVAQKLYESGHITYMRTDSVNMSVQAQNQARAYINKVFGEKYVSKKGFFYSSPNKSAQEAHECIRPVNFNHTAESLNLSPEEKKLYSLIWKRNLSSLMSEAILESMNLVIHINEYEFRSNGAKIIFDGFLKVSTDKVTENILPEIEVGKEVFPNNIDAIQHYTEPPARFSEATLIKKLEELGIGRPSTYASIISTIISRKYVESLNKYLNPTDTGKMVNKLLVKYFPKIVDYGFTKDMEDDLDKVAEGKKDWVKMLSEFYFPFEKEVNKQDKNIPRSEFTEIGKSDKKCPLCKKNMVIKLGRFGKFLSCSDYPKCKGMLSMDGKSDKDIQKEKDTAEFKKTYNSAPKAEDGRDYLLKQGRFGRFWAHPDYPKVKDAKPLEFTHNGLLEKYGEIPKTDDGRDYVVRRGRFGEFWAHPDYPEKKDIIRIKKKIEKTV